MISRSSDSNHSVIKMNMQLIYAVDKTIVFLMITAIIIMMSFLQASSSDTTDTLKPGDTLNSTSYLVSANGLFALGFYTPHGTSSSYIAIWYNNLTAISWLSQPVWIGNRNDPVPHIGPSTTLTLSSSGKLSITKNGGPETDPQASIVLYKGRESIRSNMSHMTAVSATLLDSGNFVVIETSSWSNSSTKSNILWESFDYPTDTLLPGMKVGVNHKTGRNWTLTSWLGELNPSPGAFSLEWDPISNKFLIKRRGVVYWTSGDFHEPNNDRLAGFENLSWEWMVHPKFTSTLDEQCFSYSVERYDGEEDPVSLWRLDYSGDLTIQGTTEAKVSLCDGYHREVSSGPGTAGCELQEQPKCRSQDQTFVRKSGSFSWYDAAGPQLVANSSLSESDCRDSCWNDCKCFAFDWIDPIASPTGGCMFWIGSPYKFEETRDGSGDRRYILSTEASSSDTTDTIKPGDTLNSNSQLVSANGLFALGFYTPQGTNSSYIAIWYNNRTDINLLSNSNTSNYPVWIGNRNDPVPHIDPSTTLTLSSTGKLSITKNGGPETDPQASIVLYKGRKSIRSNKVVVSATLLDSGNFVVKETISWSSSTTSNILWESFDYPTDTLLPGMKVGVNHKTGRNWSLTSWLGELNPAPGAFSLEWDPTSNGFLIKRRGVVYWTSGKFHERNNDGLTGFENLSWDWRTILPSFTSTVDEKCFSYSVKWNGQEDSPFSLWRLDYSGDFTLDGTQLTTTARVSLCDGYHTKVSSGPGTAGCELREQPKCRSPDQTFVLRSGRLAGMMRLVANSSLSETDCKDNCWNDCECFAFELIDRRVSPTYAGCVYWRGTNYKFEQTLDGSGDRQYILSTNSSGKGKKRLIEIITFPAVVMVMLLIFGMSLLIVQRSKQRKRKEKELEELMRLEGYTEAYELENGGLPKGRDLRQFTYASMLEATNNFSPQNKLGEGGFGPVYKGKLPGSHEIAVKLLSRRSEQGLLEFKTELVLISKLQHVNLVKLQGFCIHGADKLIVYDYMPNKSLDFFLFDPMKKEQLDWERRLNIIEGIAQGLVYLHKHSRLKIIHRDLKSNNILLDENMNPKISDFGLAKIFKQDTLEANTLRRVGTYGYMAPEYAMQGIFSTKSDVYSFGVLVLEIVSGRKNNSFHNIEGPLNLVEYAWEIWNNNSAEELMDPTLRGSCKLDQFQRCILIGLLCVENRAVDRPTIEEVISMLKNEMPSLPSPKNPAFITRNCVVEELAKSTPEKMSKNDLTFSETLGR